MSNPGQSTFIVSAVLLVCLSTGGSDTDSWDWGCCCFVSGMLSMVCDAVQVELACSLGEGNLVLY